MTSIVKRHLHDFASLFIAQDLKDSEVVDDSEEAREASACLLETVSSENHKLSTLSLL